MADLLVSMPTEMNPGAAQKDLIIHDARAEDLIRFAKTPAWLCYHGAG